MDADYGGGDASAGPGTDADASDRGEQEAAIKSIFFCFLHSEIANQRLDAAYERGEAADDADLLAAEAELAKVRALLARARKRLGIAANTVQSPEAARHESAAASCCAGAGVSCLHPPVVLISKTSHLRVFHCLRGIF